MINNLVTDTIQLLVIKQIPMTVCVAALAEDGKKVVIAADNMFTMAIGNSQYQKEDPSHKKIHKINDDVYVLTSGMLDIGIAVMQRVKQKINKNTTPDQALEIVKGCFVTYSENVIEEQILRPYGYDWDFFRNKQLQLNSDIVKEIQGKILNASNLLNSNLQMIIAGYDKTKNECNIRSATPNTFVTEGTTIGFLTIGAGGDFAKYSLLLNNYNKSLPIADVKVKVKKAIQDAKKAPGVGDLGELVVLPLPSEKSDKKKKT